MSCFGGKGSEKINPAAFLQQMAEIETLGRSFPSRTNSFLK
jgi:hypothetical protein